MTRREKVIHILQSEFHQTGDAVERAANKIMAVMRYGARSKEQNDYYWGVVVTMLSDRFGYSKDEIHEILKWKFLRAVEPGKPDRIRSTRDITTLEAEAYYEQIRRWAAAEYNVYIPLPSERAL